MSRKRPITHDFNSMFGAPINLKKTKEKLINGKKDKLKEKNKENEVILMKKKKKEKKIKKEDNIKHEPIMKSPPPKSKKVFKNYLKFF